MIKAGDKIIVHIYDTQNKEIKTRNYSKIFTVYEKAGQLGIDWNDFEALEHFATCNGSVVFETV